MRLCVCACVRTQWLDVEETKWVDEMEGKD
jgi:hypothetical protein